jgi:hypothetical protein
VIRGEVKVVVTTPDYRAGQAAAWADFRKDPDSEPNHEILENHCTPEFRLGYLDEFDHFITPARARLAQQE